MAEGMGDKGPSRTQTERGSSAWETQLVCRESPAWALGITGLLVACPQSLGMGQLEMVSTNPGQSEWLLSPMLCWDQCPRVLHLGAMT